MSEQALYTAAQSRKLDSIAIEEFGVPGIRLMHRAGRAAFDLLAATWPENPPLAIFCGTGNNGGDGYIVATLARNRGIPARVYQLGDPGKIGGDALRAREAALAAGVQVSSYPCSVDFDSVVIVDAMLGTGLTGEVRGDYVTAIEAINDSGRPVLAIDIPSGLCSDTGRRLGTAVLADATVTFIGMKQGLLTGAAPDYCGELRFADLEIPPAVYDRVPAASYRLDLDKELSRLPAVAATAHKGVFGHALVVGGDVGMAGAAIMAAEAAARSGAGLVSAATRSANLAGFNARRPEVMAHGVEARGELEALLARATAVAVGPGLGQGAWGEQLLQRVAETELPLVLDADALNLVAAGLALEDPSRGRWILTPHPGEAARLLDTDTAAVQADRFAAVREMQSRYGGVVVLKGAGTLVADSKSIALCPYGNPGMASGGMGDVLSGILAALLAQGLSLRDAACLGVCLHGAAADRAAADGLRGLLATDLIPHLRQLIDA